MRVYALVELGDSEAIDLFLREEDARAGLEDAIEATMLDWTGCGLHPMSACLALWRSPGAAPKKGDELFNAAARP